MKDIVVSLSFRKTLYITEVKVEYKDTLLYFLSNGYTDNEKLKLWKVYAAYHSMHISPSYSRRIDSNNHYLDI